MSEGDNQDRYDKFFGGGEIDIESSLPSFLAIWE